MRKEVRLSKKEQKRLRTAQEQGTYERHKAASRRRTMSLREWDEIFKTHGVPGPAELQRVIEKLIVEFRDGGVHAKDYGLWIFDPRRTDLTKLPIGLLDHKEEALPPELLPNSRDDLRLLCERMIIRNRNLELVNFVVDGWPGEGEPAQKLNQHITDLWHLSSVKPDIYRALLCGQHYRVIEYLWRQQPPKPFTRQQLRRLLLCQALLWCTNDIQLILARNALAERNPFGAMIISKKTKLEPARIVNDLRGRMVLLRTLLDLYVTRAAEATGGETAEVPDDPVAKLLERRIEQHAASKQIDLLSLREKLDEIVPHLKRLLAAGGTKFWRELEKPVTSDELSKHFHGIWFAGLSNLRSSAVPLLRYIQAEAELGSMIEELVIEKGKRVEARRGTALPAFAASRLKHGWKSRAKRLLHLYRQQLLVDPDRTKKDRKPTDRITSGWTAIEAALTFLDERGERLIEHHHGNAGSVERAFYLLDIIPEARLHRRLGWIDI